MKKRKVVIIGAGLGGVSAAITLAQDPENDITLLERNNHLGGKLNVTEKEGFTFDLGPSIFTMPFVFEKLFSLHGKKMEDYFTLEAVRPHWRNFFEDGTVIDLEKDIQLMKNPPSSLNDVDLKDLENFLNYSKKLYEFSDQVYFKNQSESLMDVMRYWNPLTIPNRSDYLHSMDEGVRKRIKNPYMIDILNFFIKYVGSSPYDAPAILNLLPYVQWEFDLWYVKGGLGNLGKGLTRFVKELGIAVRTGTDITEIQKAEGKITHVISSDGVNYPVDLLISNMEVIPFYEKVSKEPAVKIKKYKERFGPACSGFDLHLGVDRKYEQLRHHNFFFAKEGKKHFDYIFHEHRLSDDPTIYLVAPMKTDPSQGPEGCELIKILPHIPVVDPECPFTEEEYSNYRNHVLNKLERMGLTDLRKHIITEELWIPETIQETYLSNQGAIYGVVSDKKKNKGFKTPKKSEFYSNLYFVGGSVNPGGGMPMAVLSGQQVYEQIPRNMK